MHHTDRQICKQTACKQKPQEIVQDFVCSLKDGRLQLASLYIQRALDASPVEVEFGSLQDILMEASRYRHLDGEGRWHLLGYAEARQLKLKCRTGETQRQKHNHIIRVSMVMTHGGLTLGLCISCRPLGVAGGHIEGASLGQLGVTCLLVSPAGSPGVLELLAQSTKLVWQEGKNIERVEQPICAPCFIQRANASTELHALEQALPGLDLQSLTDLTQYVPFIILAIVGDKAAANIRLKSHLLGQVLKHNATGKAKGKLLMLDIFCIGHVLVGIFVKVFSLTALIPKCYALNFVFKFPYKYNRLVKIIRNKIEQDLVTGGYVEIANDEHGVSDQEAEWALHTSRILSLTLLRQLRTRGRDAASSIGINEALLRSLYELLRKLLNGDIRGTRVTHLCRGCCAGPRDCAAKLSDGIIVGYVEPMVSKTPATNRNYTLEQALSASGGLCLVHDLAGQTIPPAIGQPCEEEQDNNGEVEDEAANFRKYVNRKQSQAKGAVETENFSMDISVATWAGETIEGLNNTFQHSEDVGKCMLDATHERGPVFEAEVELHKRIMSSSDTMFPLEFLVHHFAVRPEAGQRDRSETPVAVVLIKHNHRLIQVRHGSLHRLL